MQKVKYYSFLGTKGAVSKNTAISIVSIINHFKQDSKPTPKIKKAIFGVKDSEIIKPLIDRSLIAIVEGKGSAYTTKKVFLIQAPPLSDDKDSQEELIGEPEEEIIGKPTEESLEESLQESLEESIEEESEESEDMSQDIDLQEFITGESGTSLEDLEEQEESLESVLGNAKFEGIIFRVISDKRILYLE